MSNLYCDLAIDGIPIWNGVPCLWSVPLNARKAYLNFQGTLTWFDSQGIKDPDYTGIGPSGRFFLMYSDGINSPVILPTQAIPNQQFDVVLGTQNCTISLYQK